MHPEGEYEPGVSCTQPPRTSSCVLKVHRKRYITDVQRGAACLSHILCPCNGYSFLYKTVSQNYVISLSKHCYVFRRVCSFQNTTNAKSSLGVNIRG